ncbi:MAG: hypothetical protein RI974_741 [Actinomycetota bacterium]
MAQTFAEHVKLHRAKYVAAAIAAPLGVAYLTVWPKELQLHCPVRMATGYLCPGCGATRACEALIQGDFASAWALSPLFVFYTALGLGVAWFTLWRNGFI